MSHQSQLEKIKYRNWVRGGLAYKYLKEGIEGFADDVVQQEHNRIVSAAGHTPGLTCTQCCLRNLRPLHKCVKDPVAGRNKCPWRQSNCNCLYPNKHPCPNQVCDRIMEDILKSHGSQPPTPNWKNIDIQKWCSDPWEIAKCFINAPGYSDKTTAADIDTPGLLHIFINNINLQSHLSDKINGNDTFKKILQTRNELFHSSTMEMEDSKLNECIDEIIAVLEDEKQLKARHDAQQAFFKLKQLKQTSFIITTHNEVEVCRDALASITNMSEELKQTIQDAKDDICKKQIEATGSIEDAKDDTDKKQKEITDTIQHAKDDIDKKQKESSDAIQDAKDDIDKKQKEALESINDNTQKAVQDALQERDKRYEILYERVGRLELETSITKQRLALLEIKVDELDTIRLNHQKQLDYAERKHEFQKQLVTLYQNHFVMASISPLKLHENNLNIEEVYVVPEMIVEDNTDKTVLVVIGSSPNTSNKRTIHQYKDILQTNGQKHKTIYVVGDVGTGKTTFCKMMIQNWCSVITADNGINKSEDSTNSDFEYSNYHDMFTAVNKCNSNEMRNFDFLFFVPLQRMSGLRDITDMIKAILTADDLASNDFVDRIFEQESERCIILADGLDEWTPPKGASVLQHVSYGLPYRGKAKHATLVTLSRPSAKGILNMRSSECDQKVELLGIDSRFVQYFIEKYLSKFNNKYLSYCGFRESIEMAKLEYTSMCLDKTPLLLQQLVWLYGSGNEVGKSLSDTYCHIVNIMLGWSQNKEEVEDIENETNETNQDKDMQLPKRLQNFPRCEANKRFLLPLARVAFETLTSETGSCTFSRLYLRKRGVPKEGITTLIKFGILVESNCFDPTQDKTHLEFIHLSYLEFFAAMYCSSCCYEKQCCSLLPKTILRDLFQNCKSAAGVLQLSNVLKMVCGLSPSLTSEVSNLVSDIVREDERMIRYRNSLPEYTLSRYEHESVQIQRLMFSCLSECESDDQPSVTLCDVIIDYTIEMPFLERIKHENVLSLNVLYLSANGQVWRWIARLKRLQYINIGFSRLPHSEMELVSSLIQEASLKTLTLYSVGCNYSGCQGHAIDLAKHDQLQRLGLTGCKRVIIPNINTKSLEMFHLDSSSISYIDFALHASSLTELIIGYTLCGYCDYSKQVESMVHSLQELRKLKLEKVDVETNVLTVTPEMNNLKNIQLLEVRMSLQTWCNFTDSLLTPKQSIQVDTAYCPVCAEIDGDGRNYVKRNYVLFEVITDRQDNFSFRTKK